ncbi:hypothetical protein [Brevibacterium oceani]|uniref:hypothetical protein n=1 Tax=Brevibacterium oceani TaxID=358099 RepID=UPI0015E7254D|nr:hypothetical protein [Brevibacterium oceani]
MPKKIEIADNEQLRGLVDAMHSVAEQQARVATALTDVAREQRITSLIVRSQISTDAEEKKRLMDEAVERMEMPRRRSPHDPIGRHERR